MTKNWLEMVKKLLIMKHLFFLIIEGFYFRICFLFCIVIMMILSFEVLFHYFWDTNQLASLKKMPFFCPLQKFGLSTCLLTLHKSNAMQKGHVHQSEERKLFRQILALGYCAPKYFFISPTMSFLY